MTTPPGAPHTASATSHTPQPAGRPPLSSPPAIVLTVIGAYTAAHAATLAPSLEDIDSINFALGLREFDVAQHQPHPPGYPVYIALGRLTLAVVAAWWPSLDAAAAAARALAAWSVAGGAVALWAMWLLCRELARRGGHAGSRSDALVPVVLLAVSPLFWIAGLRPMSDMPGLAAALLAQALLVRGFADRRALVAGAVVSGLAAGFRVQAMWLTAPLFVAALIAQRRAGLRWLLSRPVAALAAALVIWLVPLMWISGGVPAYLAALGSQAGEDFSWVDMLWANPTPRRVAFALLDTFAAPWSAVALAALVGIMAAAGLVVTFVRERAALAIASVAFFPYLAGHLLFQETAHVRYALPTLPLVVWLAARGMAAVGPLAVPIAAIVAVWSLVLAVPAAVQYGREAHPAFRAIGEMRRAAAAGPPAAVHSHYALRRPLQTVDDPRLSIVVPRREYEWLGMADYWRGGGAAEIWFLADPRRHDLESIDRDARRAVVHYPWALADRAELGGTRPQAVDWYRIRPPGWFVTEGWALTPETGGLARARGHGIHRQPIHAFVRRRSGPIRILVGGRYLDSGPIRPVDFALTVDGAPIAAWRFGPDAGGLNFLRMIEVPAGVPPGDGPYARLTLTASAAGGGPVPETAIRQFDLQPLDGLIVGFDAGWHEAEFDSATGLRWRWSSGRSSLRVAAPGAVALRLRGESPLKYFAAAPTVKVTLAGETVGTLRPSDDFDWQVTLPAAALARAGGVVMLEQDRVYRPGAAEGTGDTRELGLRLFAIDAHPVAP